MKIIVEFSDEEFLLFEREYLEDKERMKGKRSSHGRFLKKLFFKTTDKKYSHRNKFIPNYKK